MSIKIEKKSNGKASLEIPLRSYIDAYHHNIDFDKVKKELSDQMREAPFIFEEFVEAALEGFSEQNKQDIIASPAYLFMRRQFAESLKNSIDSVLSYHENETAHAFDVVILDITIENTSNDITITLSDNGKGFPQHLLEKISTKAQRLSTDYYHHDTKTSKALSQKKELYIGGAGQGLAELIGLADKGDPKFGQEKGKGEYRDVGIKMEGLAESTLYDLPEKSELVFSNKSGSPDNHGTVISLTTSIAPIYAKTHIISSDTTQVKTQPRDNDESDKENYLTLPNLKNKRCSTPSASTTKTPSSPVTVQERESPQNSTTIMRKLMLKIRIDDEDNKQDNQKHQTPGK